MMELGLRPTHAQISSAMGKSNVFMILRTGKRKQRRKTVQEIKDAAITANCQPAFRNIEFHAGGRQIPPSVANFRSTGDG